MKKIIGSLFLVALLLAPVASGATRDPRVPALQQKVAALQQQVASLNAEVSKLDSAMTTNVNYDVCMTAVNFDIFDTMDREISALAQLPPPNLTPFDDKGACAAIGITRTPASADPFMAAVNKGRAAFGLYMAWLARHS